MKIKMNNTESGRHPDCDAGSYHCLVGLEYEMPDDLAEAWVKKGIATKVRAKKGDVPPKSTKKSTTTDVAEEANDGD